MNRLAKSAAVTVLGTVLGLAIGLSPAAGAATVVSVDNLRGPLVNASFSAPDPSDSTGCSYIEAFVSANAGIDQQLPNTLTVGVAGIDVDTYNACTGLTIFQAAGLTEALPATDFWVSKQLDRAWLHTTLTLTDIDSGRAFALQVELTWTGISDTYRDHSNTNEIYSRGCHVLDRWKGSGRDAAASGTVTDTTTNYTPAVSQYAEIGWVVGGSEVIGCS